MGREGDFVERRLAAILAGDVVGYSRLMGLDEEGTAQRVKSLFGDIIRPEVSEHRGRVVKTTGDGVLAEFPSVVDAFHCAVAIQRAVIKCGQDSNPDERIQFRIGINIGEIIFDDGDVFGDGVNIAARLESIANPGGICISGRAWDDLRRLPFRFVDLGERELKNIERPVRVFSVALDSTSPQVRALVGPNGALRARNLIYLGLIVGSVTAALIAFGRYRAVDAQSFVTSKISSIPCSWLRVSERSNVDGVESFRLSGASLDPPESIAQSLIRSATNNNVRIDRINTSDVAPIYPSQCSGIDKLKEFRYTGVSRFTLVAQPFPYSKKAYSHNLTSAALTFVDDALGPNGAIYGMDSAGKVTRLADRPMFSEIIAGGNGTKRGDRYTFNIDLDHVGWNGFILAESNTPIPKALVERTIESASDLTQFDKLAKRGRWRFELVWFKAAEPSGETTLPKGSMDGT